MIGVIGLGKMGSAIATRLLAEGHELTVWNRSIEKANASALSAAAVAQSPIDVVKASDVVLCVMANDEANDVIYQSDEGIVSADLKGKLIIDFCTMSPERARVLEALVLKQNGLFLECPVGGTIGPALQGQLLGLAGGSDDAFAKAQPVLEKLTRRLEHFGPVGTGSAMKLAINLPLVVYWTALGEALSIAKSYEIDPAKALDVLSDSSGAIGVAKKRVPAIVDMVVDGNKGGANFSIENAIKDMELMMAVAKANGTTSEVVANALARFLRAQGDGFDGLDFSLVTAFENQS